MRIVSDVPEGLFFINPFKNLHKQMMNADLAFSIEQAVYGRVVREEVRIDERHGGLNWSLRVTRLVNKQAGLIGRPAGQRLEKLQAGRPKGVKKLDGLDRLDSLCEVGDEAVGFAVKAISRYFSGVRV